MVLSDVILRFSDVHSKVRGVFLLHAFLVGYNAGLSKCDGGVFGGAGQCLCDGSAGVGLGCSHDGLVIEGGSALVFLPLLLVEDGIDDAVLGVEELLHLRRASADPLDASRRHLFAFFKTIRDGAVVVPGKHGGLDDFGLAARAVGFRLPDALVFLVGVVIYGRHVLDLIWQFQKRHLPASVVGTAVGGDCGGHGIENKLGFD